jgi:hypothetical protein
MTEDVNTAVQKALYELDLSSPEWIDSAIGDRVFYDQDGYDELLVSWRAMRREEILENAANGFPP